MKKLTLILILLLVVLSASGCTEDKEDTVDEVTDIGDENSVDAADFSENTEGQWCPVGSTIQTSDPQTGQAYTVDIVGKETIEGIEMCHATAELDESENGVSSLEYFWSEDEENMIMKFYDDQNTVISEMRVVDGKVSINAANGFSMEFDENSQM